MDFAASTLGIVNVGHATVDADVSSDSYQISASMQSGGLLSLFQHTTIEASASGRLSESGVIWQHYDLDHHYSRKHRVIAMHTDDSGATIAEINPTYRVWGDPRASDAQIRQSRDPLSSLMAMAIDVGQSHRCAGAYPTFDGRFLYLLQLADGEEEDYDGGGYSGPVLKCVLSYIPVAGYEARDAGRIRIPHGQVWFALAAGANFAPPIRVVTPLAAGGATIRLTGWRHALVSVADSH